MRAHVREQALLPEGLAFRNVAYMYFHHRYTAVLNGIAQRYTRVGVAARVEYDTNILVVGFLNPVYEVALMVRLTV